MANIYNNTLYPTFGTSAESKLAYDVSVLQGQVTALEADITTNQFAMPYTIEHKKVVQPNPEPQTTNRMTVRNDQDYTVLSLESKLETGSTIEFTNPLLGGGNGFDLRVETRSGNQNNIVTKQDLNIITENYDVTLMKVDRGSGGVKLYPTAPVADYVPAALNYYEHYYTTTKYMLPGTDGPSTPAYELLLTRIGTQVFMRYGANNIHMLYPYNNDNNPYIITLTANLPARFRPTAQHVDYLSMFIYNSQDSTNWTTMPAVLNVFNDGSMSICRTQNFNPLPEPGVNTDWLPWTASRSVPTNYIMNWRTTSWSVLP